MKAPLSYFLLSSALIFLSSVQAEDKVKGIPLVETTSVNFQTLQVPVRSSGILENKTQQKQSFKVSGVIADILVDEGDTVSAGQLLASLDKAEIEAQVKRTDSVYNNAVTNLKRFKQLFEDKVISSEQLQSAETQVDVAKSNLEIARFNLKHSEIRATSNGKVLRRLVEQNEFVAPNQPIFVVSNNEAGWVLRMGVSDKDIVKVALGNQANIRFDAYGGYRFVAKVSEIAAAVNSRSRLFEVELELSATEKPLYSGFIGRAEIESSNTSNLAILPIEAIVTAEGKQGKVYILNADKTASARAVDIAFVRHNEVAIVAGLSDGEMVITTGSGYVQPGLPVRLMP